MAGENRLRSSEVMPGQLNGDVEVRTLLTGEVRLLLVFESGASAHVDVPPYIARGIAAQLIAESLIADTIKPQ